MWAVLDPIVTPLDGARTVQAFRARLLALPEARVHKIDQEFEKEFSRAYSWRLWGAAYVINGGCSDDCFDYFRGWLVMQGSAVFKAAIRDPDSLADYPYLEQPFELEEAVSVTTDAYREAFGTEPDNASVKPNLGPSWDFDDQAEMRRRYPKLARKFKF